MWDKFTNFLKWAVASDFGYIVSQQPKEKVAALEPFTEVEPEPVTKTESEPVTERVRARTIKGRYIADDKSTPDIDEAWTTKKVNIKRIKKYKK